MSVHLEDTAKSAINNALQILELNPSPGNQIHHDLDRLLKSAVEKIDAGEKFLIDHRTGSVYHRDGHHICAHAISADGTFSTDCRTAAATVDHVDELPEDVRNVIASWFQ